jgi:ferric-dicitrate binding protein FerR (iron transport regulator)
MVFRCHFSSKTGVGEDGCKNIIQTEITKMEKDKLISFIISGQPFVNHPDVADWINTSEENKEEYIRYKNLLGVMQTGSDMSEAKIQGALAIVRKKQNRLRQSSWHLNFMRYAAIVAIALLGGYFIGTHDFDNQIAMNEISVPNGNRSSVKLPDGTKAWLNNGTKLIFPEEFKGRSRVVELEGEGFFEVAHDEKRPFIVKIGESRIKVMGTKFAVVAYPNDRFIKAELVSGEIQFDTKENDDDDEFQSYLMSPSQSLVFDKTSGTISESSIKDSFYDYWLNGVYQFKDELFEELAKKIERIYNVKVTFEEESLKKRLFSGTLSPDDNIYTLMEVFRSATGEPFTYTREGNHILIKR